jgi:threonine dehydratase
MPDSLILPTITDIEAARAPASMIARVTPLIASRQLSAIAHAPVWLKAEVLQRTGSFKVRGAATFLAALDQDTRQRGVIAASAGNHAQGVAVAAAAFDAPCHVVMPVGTALPKERATREYGAVVVLHGQDLGESVVRAKALALEHGWTFVPPFDDLQIIAGQGTLGLELFDQAPDLEVVIIPVGGGGLAAGTAMALKDRNPDMRVIGVQAEAMASAVASFGEDAPLAVEPASTLADGCAVPRVGNLTLPLLNRYVDEIVAVSEEWISTAMVWLLERSKLVVEGAGALGVAALLAGVVDVHDQRTAVVLSGGNIDINSLARSVEHGLARAGRYLQVVATVPDQPGHLARLLAVTAQSQANVLDVWHRRSAPSLPIGAVEIELLLETRDVGHAAALVEALLETGLRQVDAQIGLVRLRDPAVSEPTPDDSA